jgi:hypothetical protein
LSASNFIVANIPIFKYTVNPFREHALLRGCALPGKAAAPPGSAIEEAMMSIDNAVFALAGTMVLVSVVLTWLVTPYGLLLAAFAGLNLLQSSLTGFCPAALVFKRLGLQPGCAFR